MGQHSQMNAACASRRTSTTSSRMPWCLWTTPTKPKLAPMKSSFFQMTLPIPTGVRVAQKYLAAPMQRPAISITSQQMTMVHVASKTTAVNAKFPIATTPLLTPFPIPQAAIATIYGSAGLCSRMQQRIRIGTPTAATAPELQMEPRSQTNVAYASKHTSTTSSRMPSFLSTMATKRKQEPMKLSYSRMTQPTHTGVRVAQKYLAAQTQRPAISITSPQMTMGPVALKTTAVNAKFPIAIIR